ncbi:isochorismate synthase [Haloarculaceae archaeon H-GB2-1]|nr:isochorismate synthase [Haloarculaceae archaeon H-GB1-1]MEA5386006.1 isochorismate synthase [Haloarculaceae archaeon H-GB11]MEA5407510.1 isochorismate synthase [Haloarculaceae archaeon H-GB2-1]
MEPLRGDEATVGRLDEPIVTRGCRVADASLDSFLDSGRHPRLAWTGDDAAIAAHGAAATVTAHGPNRFQSVRADAEALFEDRDVPDDLPRVARPRLFGGFAFHASGTDPSRSDLWNGFPDAAFFLPAVQLTRADDEIWLSVTATGPDAVTTARDRLETWEYRLSNTNGGPTRSQPAITARRYRPSREGWRSQVRAALEQVERGSLRKVVLAQALTLDLDATPSVSAVLASLGETYPDCRRFLFAPDAEGTFFGATPERLVSLQGRTVRTEALAGSTGRGETPAEDEWLVEQLLESEKDAHEHELVVDAIRDQLVPLASTVRTGERSIRRLATVQHLRTKITAELAADEHVLSLVDALHPTPAVGGLPPDAALATIRETEAFDRGWYAAPVGWFDAAGNGSFAVALRSALVREAEATLFAGAGIVANSDPDAEWDEVQLKYRPILDELE